mmetsp:Transcript_29597/g.45110  ORF Transcript_29597/g.45110 Transcript_29597/m.45110 type:complete len:128 (+) Transcript_29597:1919-2302(+)
MWEGSREFQRSAASGKPPQLKSPLGSMRPPLQQLIQTNNGKPGDNTLQHISLPKQPVHLEEQKKGLLPLSKNTIEVNLNSSKERLHKNFKTPSLVHDQKDTSPSAYKKAFKGPYDTINHGLSPLNSS